MSVTLEVRVLTCEAAVPVLLDEFRQALGRRGVISFATGNTFAPFLRALAVELQAGRIATDFLATHLDEYLGFGPQQRGGMVHELCTACPPLGSMLARGAFLPVPSDGAEASLKAHAAKIASAGGVALQFLGIGRNGHLAFNEPGTPFDRGLHVARLAETTRDDARWRFLPGEPPTHAVTSGIATILDAKRIVLCAFGRAKADALRAMLHGEGGAVCPASALRGHARVLVLIDRDAQSGIDPRRVGCAP
ncbi:MAG TPA: 6-phosphogluconolactonase [Planctomycetota bacterium]|nr:6-phosphogluconolactonase [Planctomycetota bacterium]